MGWPITCFKVRTLRRITSGLAALVAGVALALGLAPKEGLVDGVFGLYASEELGVIGILLLAGLALGGMVLQARDLTPDDAVISPDQFRNPGVGGSGGGPAAA